MLISGTGGDPTTGDGTGTTAGITDTTAGTTITGLYIIPITTTTITIRQGILQENILTERVLKNLTGQIRADLQDGRALLLRDHAAESTTTAITRSEEHT